MHFPRFFGISLIALLAPTVFPHASDAAQSTHEARMEAVQAWLDEDAALAESSKMTDLAATRRADFTALAASRPSETALAAHEDLLPPIARFDGNPVAKGFFNRLQGRVLKADRRFPKGHEGGKARSEEGWAFIVRADELHDLAEAFCHPQSPMAGDPVLIAPILRRLAFFSEYMAKGGPVLGDFGPCGTIADAYLILVTCRPEIIPPSLRRGMEEGIQNNADAIIAKSKAWYEPVSAAPETKCLVNCDVNLVLALAIANRLFPSETYAEAVRRGLAYIEPHILADGATNYFGQHNECFSYHAAAVRALTRTAQITGDPKPMEMVKRLRWYYPFTVSPTGVAEWSTATSWHHYWNTANGADCAAIMAGLLNCPHNQRVANLGFVGNLWNASWWNPDRPAAACPDNFMAYDRNIEGPRARFGQWSCVGTTRRTIDNRGKSSYAGCVIETGESTPWALDSALQDAGMEIRPDPSKEDVSEHHGRITGAHEEKVVTCAVGERAASLGAVAKLGSYGKPATDWITRQLWLFTPERMVGLVTLEAGQDAIAAGIFGDLFLVSGRSNWGTRKELKDLGDGKFSYGQMMITFHARDFAGFESEYTDVMGGGYNQSSAKKSCRLLLVDESAKSGAMTTYGKGTRRFYLVEVRPAFSSEAKVSLVKNETGLLAFDVADGTGRYSVAFNSSESIVEIPGGRSGILHRSGEKFRPDWLKEAGTVDMVHSVPIPAMVTVPPGQVVFLADH